MSCRHKTISVAGT